MAQACGRVMRPGSSIVNIGSRARLHHGRSRRPRTPRSKAAIIGLTRDLAVQWTGPQGHPRERARPGSSTARRQQYRGLPRRPTAAATDGPSGRARGADRGGDLLAGDASSYITACCCRWTAACSAHSHPDTRSPFGRRGRRERGPGSAHRAAHHALPGAVPAARRSLARAGHRRHRRQHRRPPPRARGPSTGSR